MTHIVKIIDFIVNKMQTKKITPRGRLSGEACGFEGNITSRVRIHLGVFFLLGPDTQALSAFKGSILTMVLGMGPGLVCEF
jgi:hypothetical protein